MDTDHLVLPGDILDANTVSLNPQLPVRLGPGLRHIPPSTITSTVAGRLRTDQNRNAVWVEYNGGRYNPNAGDLVIATIHHSSMDVYFASITDYTPFASLPHLSFEGVTKKTRPQLAAGSLVYARVSLANKHMDPEIECVSASTGKSDGLGPLTGGMLFNISTGMARRLMMPRPATQGGLVVLDEFDAAGVAFETAVGRNGKVWVNSKASKSVLAVGKAIQETDSRGLDVDEQKKLVKKLVKDL